jgi:hypothetical protein
MTLELVEGWTGPVPLTLQADGVAAVLTGLTVTAQLYDRDGTAVDASGDVTVTSAAVGQVEWNPDAVDLDADLSPYELRFKARDASSLDVFFPNGLAVTVLVRR